jgi:hypothetical protein
MFDFRQSYPDCPAVFFEESDYFQTNSRHRQKPVTNLQHRFLPITEIDIVTDIPNS